MVTVQAQHLSAWRIHFNVPGTEKRLNRLHCMLDWFLFLEAWLTERACYPQAFNFRNTKDIWHLYLQPDKITALMQSRRGNECFH